MFLKKLCKKSLVFPFFKQNDQYSGISDPYDQNTHPQFVYPRQSEESVKKNYRNYNKNYYKNNKNYYYRKKVCSNILKRTARPLIDVLTRV